MAPKFTGNCQGAVRGKCFGLRQYCAGGITKTSFESKPSLAMVLISHAKPSPLPVMATIIDA